MIWAEEVTGNLQKNSLSDLSSVTMDELDAPTLDKFVPGSRADEPARGGGVVCAGGIIVAAQEDADTPSLLGGQLKPPRFDVRQAHRRRDRRRDGGAA